MLKDQTIISVVGIISISVLTGIALLKGINGALFMTGIAIIGGIAGYELKALKEKLNK